MICTVDDCDRRVRARGMCNMHYGRWKRHGHPHQTVKRRWTPEEDEILMAAALTPHGPRRAGPHPTESLAAVAKRLGRTPKACLGRRDILERKAGHQGGPWTREGLWTLAEDALIRARMWEVAPRWAEVAAQLGRTPKAVLNRASKLRKTSRAVT